MANYCLPRQLANTFKQKLVNGEIDPEKLAQMTSQDRHDFFKSFLGEENAKNTNSLFESKLLLKNQQRGMITWAKTVSGIKDTTRKDLIARISNMDHILNPTNEQAFLKDLASTRLGTNVTLDEAKNIFTLSKTAEEAKATMLQDMSNIPNRISYGNAKLDIMEYMAEINHKKAPFLLNLIGLPRSLVASLDFVSAPFRHGWGMMSTTNFWKNYVNMPKYAFSEKAFRNKMADIISRPTYDLMKDSKLSIFGFNDNLSMREEQFMSNILDHFPITRGSQRAYMGFLNGLRADSFDQMVRSADLAGENVTKGSSVLKDIANVVNNFTGAANLGKFEHITPELNAVFFSPRKMVATINMLNPLTYINPKTSPTARKTALRNILGSAGMSATLLTLAGLNGASIEINPDSSDFGQIRIGNTRIDVTGGNRTYATLIARLMTGQTKSTTTGAITTLGQKFGSQTRMDVFTQYATNKLAPTASFFSDWLYGKTGTQPFDLTKEIEDRIIPMNITDGMNLLNTDNNNAAMGIMMGLFGVPVTAYSSQTDWTASTSKTLDQFRTKVGNTQFMQANQEYNDTLNTKLQQLQNDPRYQSLSDTNKQKTVTKLKANVQKQILKQYKFKPKKTVTKKNKTITDLSNL